MKQVYKSRNFVWTIALAVPCHWGMPPCLCAHWSQGWWSSHPLDTSPKTRLANRSRRKRCSIQISPHQLSLVAQTQGHKLQHPSQPTVTSAPPSLAWPQNPQIICEFSKSPRKKLTLFLHISAFRFRHVFCKSLELVNWPSELQIELAKGSPLATVPNQAEIPCTVRSNMRFHENSYLPGPYPYRKEWFKIIVCWNRFPPKFPMLDRMLTFLQGFLKPWAGSSGHVFGLEQKNVESTSGLSRFEKFCTFSQQMCFSLCMNDARNIPFSLHFRPFQCDSDSQWPQRAQWPSSPLAWLWNSSNSWIKL